MKICFFVIACAVALMLVAGCTGTPTCIPVTPSAKYLPSGENDFTVVVIGDKAFPAYHDAYTEIKLNETQLLKFDKSPAYQSALITGVCKE